MLTQVEIAITCDHENCDSDGDNLAKTLLTENTATQLQRRCFAWSAEQTWKLQWMFELDIANVYTTWHILCLHCNQDDRDKLAKQPFGVNTLVCNRVLNGGVNHELSTALVRIDYITEYGFIDLKMI